MDPRETQDEVDDLIAKGDNLLAASKALLADLDDALANGDGPQAPPAPPRPSR